MSQNSPKTFDDRASPPADDPEFSAVEAAERTVEAEAARTEALEAEISTLKDQLLRALAETENVRRRAQREREDASKYAIADFAREIVPVADNLRRAVEAVPPEALDSDEHLKNLMTGVELTERTLLTALERFGIRRIDPFGEPFDYNFHQAVSQMEDPSQPNGTVVHVMQVGYTLRDRLLRPAMVVVSKGGPAAPEGAPPHVNTSA